MLLTVLLPAGAGAKQVASPLALVLSGEECPCRQLSAALEQAVIREQTAGGGAAAALVAQQEVAGALARTRADRALSQARRLYTKANFAGCISLLSITEQELGRHLGASDPAREAQAHRLLGQVNLWLGICQWAAGDPHPAAASFARASRLPGSAAPDPTLLPPELVAAFKAAVAAEQPLMRCTLGQSLREDTLRLTIDGRAVAEPAAGLAVDEGTHYLVLHARCAGACPLSQLLGPGGQRSVRLVASPGGCQLDLSPLPDAAGLPCLSPSEADDPTFLAALTQESGAGGSLALVLQQGKVSLRLQRGRRADFLRQVSTRMEAGGTISQVLSQTLGLVLGGEQSPPPTVAARPWYRRWWVWALAGTAVAASAATSTYFFTRNSDRVTVRFGP